MNLFWIQCKNLTMESTVKCCHTAKIQTMSTIRIHLLRNNKDDTITIYPHDRRTDAVVVKHRYSENLETDTLLVVRRDELACYFNSLFEYVFSTIRMKATDSYKRIGINVPGLPHFDQEITADVQIGVAGLSDAATQNLICVPSWIWTVISQSPAARTRRHC